MHRVQPSAAVVKRPEQHPDWSRIRLYLEMKTRHDMALGVIEVILGALDAEERDPERGGGEQKPFSLAQPALGDGVDRQHHRQAAGQQQEEIYAAGPYDRVMCVV